MSSPSARSLLVLAVTIAVATGGAAVVTGVVDGSGVATQPEPGNVSDDDVVINGDGTVVSGLQAESGNIIGTLETASGKLVLINEEEQLVTETGGQITTSSGDEILRFENEEPDLRTANEPFEELELDGNTIVTAENGTTVVGPSGNSLVVKQELDTDIEITDINDPDEGESLDVTAEVTNSGFTKESVTVTLDAGPLGGTADTGELVGEDSGTVSFSFDDLEALREVDVVVRTQDGAEDSRSINVREDRIFISNVEWPESVNVTETFRPTVSIRRIGGSEEIETNINFSVDDRTVANRIFTIGGGTNTTETLRFEPGLSEAPEMNFSVTIDEADDGQEFGPVGVSVPAPDFQVNITDVSDPIPRTGFGYVTAEIENTGVRQGEQNVSLYVDESGPLPGPDPWEQRGSTVVGLETNESTTVQFQYEPEDPLTETVNFEVRSEQRADTASGRLGDVEPRLEPEIVDITDPVEPGETLIVTVALENRGGVGDPQRLELQVGEPNSTSSFELADVRTVSLEPGLSRTDRFTYSTDDVTGDSLAVELRTNYTAVSETVRVDRPRPDLALVSATPTNETLPPGDPIGFTVTLENTGRKDGETPVSLWLDDEQITSETVTVGSNGSERLTLETNAPGSAGTYEYRIDGPSSLTTAVSVQSNDTDGDGTGTETESQDDQFEVVDPTLNATTVAPGDGVRIDAEIVNNGDEMANYLAGLEVDGNTVSTQEVPSIPPDGESIPIRFTYTFEEPGNATVAINGTEAGTVTVQEGGGLLGFLPLGLLDFLPWGLLRTAALFVLLPVLLVYLGLKALAIYLGY